MCNSCGNTFNLSGFYKISEPDKNFPDGCVNVCKRCCQEQWNDPQFGFKNFMEFLRITNLPYIKRVYNNAADKPAYIGSMRSAKYVHMRFIDSDEFVEEKAAKQIKENTLKELTPDQIRECELFWGKGYSEDEYIYLMNEYAEYNNEYDLSDKIMKTLIAQAVAISLRIRKITESGGDTSKLTKEFSDIIGSANLKPAQAKAAEDSEHNTWGGFIEMIERNEPIPEPLEKYKDVDGIIKYVKAFFANPMARAMGVEQPYPELQKTMLEKLSVDKDSDEDDKDG